MVKTLDMIQLKCYNRFFITIPILDDDEIILKIVQSIRAGSYSTEPQLRTYGVMNCIRTMPELRNETDEIVEKFIATVMEHKDDTDENWDQTTEELPDLKVAEFLAKFVSKLVIKEVDLLIAHLLIQYDPQLALDIIKIRPRKSAAPVQFSVLSKDHDETTLLSANRRVNRARAMLLLLNIFRSTLEPVCMTMTMYYDKHVTKYAHRRPSLASGYIDMLTSPWDRTGLKKGFSGVKWRKVKPLFWENVIVHVSRSSFKHEFSLEILTLSIGKFQL